jgi:hypothetical protein
MKTRFRDSIKSLLLCGGFAVAQQAGAFTLWGPFEPWQTTTLDFSPGGSTRYYYANIETDTLLDYYENGGSKGFGEGSRLSTPIITYGFDATFLEYFGEPGVAAVDAAMNVMNGLPAASSANLGSFMTQGIQQINYTAQAMSMLDIKSTVMWLMLEHMGLQGETHVFDMLSRDAYGVLPCHFDYIIANRNFDPVTYDPTPYVNGRLYGYSIFEGCQEGGQAVPVADAIEQPADANQPRYTAVASGQGLEVGGYYLGITRDDMGGLAYLYNRNYYVYQALDSNSVPLTNSLPVGINSPWQIATTNVATNAPVTPVTPTANTIAYGLFGGVEKITFVKVQYDSLLGPTFTPITYNYTIPYVTNSTLSQLAVTRTVTSPDIVFTAANFLDLATPLVVANPFDDSPVLRTGAFIAQNPAPAAPYVTGSTIAPQMTVVFNDVGPIYVNQNPYYMDNNDNLGYPVFVWGSFDGSANPPVQFPAGTSLAALEAAVLANPSPAPTTNSSILPVWNPVSLVNTNITTGTGTTATGTGTTASGGGL